MEDEEEKEFEHSAEGPERPQHPYHDLNPLHGSTPSSQQAHRTAPTRRKSPGYFVPTLTAVMV